MCILLTYRLILMRSLYSFFISAITWHNIQQLSRIYPVCSTYELTKQFMPIWVKNCAINLKKNNLYYKSMQNSVWLDCPKCPWIVMSLQYLWKQYSYWKKRQSPSLTRQFMGETFSALLNMCVKSCYLQPFFIIPYFKGFYVIQNFSLSPFKN